MALRAVKPTTYADIQRKATSLQSLASAAKITLAAANTSGNEIKQLLELFIRCKSDLQTAAAVPGIATYAQTQEGDGGYNVAAEFTAMINACTGVINTITGLIPTAVSGGQSYVAVEQWTAAGITVRSFTPAQTLGLRNALDTFIATVG
jgi:hypothetical protein